MLGMLMGLTLWYSGRLKGRNGVGISVDMVFREHVVDVRRINDRMLMMIKLADGGLNLNIFSAYPLQGGSNEAVRKHF